MRRTPPLADARAWLRHLITEARAFDTDHANGVRGVIDTARLAIPNAWRDYRAALRIHLNPNED